MQATATATAHASPAAPTLACRSNGTGAAVVCLHSSTGTGGQWRALADTLSARWRVLLPDLHGHGASPAWPQAAVDAPSLALDADAVAQLAGDGPVHLVGHSYGAAVALQLALQHPQRVRSLTLYEPVAFGLLRAQSPLDDALEEIEDVAASVATLVQRGALTDAARVFTGYWGGSRAWAALNAAQQQVLTQRIVTVPSHFDALFAAQWTRQQLQTLQMPVLLLRGSATRASARRVTELLAQALPHAQCGVLPGAGHLGPITHGSTVASWMTAHIDPLLARRLATAAAQTSPV